VPFYSPADFFGSETKRPSADPVEGLFSTRPLSGNKFQPTPFGQNTLEL